MPYDETAYILDWLKAFALTVAVEVPIVAVLLRREEPALSRRVGLAFFAQLASHPLVWFVFASLPLASWSLRVAIAEAWAFGSEVVFYLVAFRGLRVRCALAASGIANLASFGLGLALQDVIFH